MLPVFVGALMYREITFSHFPIGYAVNQKKFDRKKSGRPNYPSVFGKTLFFFPHCCIRVRPIVDRQLAGS